MKPKNILVPTDFGESAGAALRQGRELAEAFDATLHVLYVTGLPLKNSQPDRARQIEVLGLERLKALLGPCDETRVKLACRVGPPLIEIVEYAKIHDIDLMVMGSHTRLPTPQMAMTSVTENIVRQAPCPVLVVQGPPHELVA